MPGEDPENKLTRAWLIHYQGASEAFSGEYGTAQTKLETAGDLYADLLNTPPPTLPEPSELKIAERAQHGLERAQYLRGLLDQRADVERQHEAHSGGKVSNLSGRLVILDQTIRAAALGRLDPYH